MRTTSLVLVLLLNSGLAIAQPIETEYSNSPDQLRRNYVAAIERKDKHEAWRLFCPATTSARISQMYRAVVEDTVSLPISVVELASLPQRTETIPHSVPLLGRLVFRYDLSKQTGPHRIGTQFLYYGKSPAGFCVALPEMLEKE